LCRPFPGKPSRDDWLALVEALAELHARERLHLAVIDTLATFLPGRNENSAGVMMESLLPLQRLTAAGLSVLLVHHPRKGKNLVAQAARGSGALAGFVDILIEMSYYSRPGDADRRRRLRAFSRHEQTPRQLVIELSTDGNDYLARSDIAEEDLGESWQGLQLLLEEAVTKLTRQEILERWPADFPAPAPPTLWRVLDRAANQGLVRQDGLGRKTAPFRYWLPARETMLRPEPGATQAEMQAWNQRLLKEFWPALAGKDTQNTAGEGHERNK
jgi:hypothetical protein